MDHDFSRLQGVVAKMPEGDPDRQDLLLLFELEKAHRRKIIGLQKKVDNLLRQEERLIGDLKQKMDENDSLGEENKQLFGALEILKITLKFMEQKLKSQGTDIGWLCMRLHHQKDLTPSDKVKIAALLDDYRLED